MNNFGLGLVGATLQGGYLLAPSVVDSVEKTGLRLRAIYDTQHENAREIERNTEYGYSQRNIPQDLYLTTDLWHMFNDFMLDAMLIAAPVEKRRALVESALSGFDKVALLSPLAGNMGDAQAIVDASREKPILLDHPRRFEAGWQKAHELLQSGLIGKLQFINLRAFLPETNYLRLWERTQTGKDDLFLGQLSNYMDVFNWFADDPCVQISGIGAEGEHDLDHYDPNGPFKETFSKLPLRWRTKVSTREPGTVVDDFPADHYLDRVAIQLRFGNNVIGSLNITSSGPAAQDAEDLELVGEKGRIWFNAVEGTLYVHFWDGSASERISSLGRTEFPLRKRYAMAFLEQLPAFIEGTAPVTTAVEGAEALKLTLAALESIQNNGVPVLIGFDIEGEYLPDMPEEPEPEEPETFDDFTVEPAAEETSDIETGGEEPTTEEGIEEFDDVIIEGILSEGESESEEDTAPEPEFDIEAMFTAEDDEELLGDIAAEDIVEGEYSADEELETVEAVAESEYVSEEETAPEPEFDAEAMFTAGDDDEELLGDIAAEDIVEGEYSADEELETVEAVAESEYVSEEDTAPEPEFDAEAMFAAGDDDEELLGDIAAEDIVESEYSADEEAVEAVAESEYVSEEDAAPEPEFDIEAMFTADDEEELLGDIAAEDIVESEYAAEEEAVEAVAESEYVSEEDAAPEPEFDIEAMFTADDEEELLGDIAAEGIVESEYAVDEEAVEAVAESEYVSEEDTAPEPEFGIESILTFEEEAFVSDFAAEESVKSEYDLQEDKEPEFHPEPVLTLEDRLEALVEDFNAEEAVPEETFAEQPEILKIPVETLEERVAAFVAEAAFEDESVYDEEAVPGVEHQIESTRTLAERVEAFVEAVVGFDEPQSSDEFEEETPYSSEMDAVSPTHEAVTQEYTVVDEDMLSAEADDPEFEDGSPTFTTYTEEPLPEPVVEETLNEEYPADNNVREPDIFSAMFAQVEEEDHSPVEDKTEIPVSVESDLTETVFGTRQESEPELDQAPEAPEAVQEPGLEQEPVDTQTEVEPELEPVGFTDFVAVDDDTEETLETTVIEEEEDEVNSVHQTEEENEDNIVESPSVVIAEKIHLDDYIWDIVPLDPIRNTVDLITGDDWEDDDPAVEIIEAVDESASMFSEAETQQIDINSNMVDWPEEMPPGQDYESFDGSFSSID